MPIQAPEPSGFDWSRFASPAFVYGVFLTVTAALWRLLTPYRQRMQVADVKDNKSEWRAALIEGPDALLAKEVADLSGQRAAIDLVLREVATLRREVEVQAQLITTLPEIRAMLDRNNIVLDRLVNDSAEVKKLAELTRTMVGDIVGVLKGRGDWDGRERRDGWTRPDRRGQSDL